MARRTNRGGALTHARHSMDLSKVPDTYIEPFTGYRAWNWSAEGVTSLNGARWTPEVAFEATCHYADDLRSMQAASSSEAAKKFWDKQAHHVPDPNCTCGMYAGISMQHLIDINYIQRGIHGEVHLWGRLYRHTLGWRSQFAYPKYFVVSSKMIPFRMHEAKQRLETLAEFGVDIYLQPEREPKVGQERIPLWVKDYGFSQRGLSLLIEKRKKWDEDGHGKTHVLEVGDCVAVSDHVTAGGIGIVDEIKNGDMYYTMFSPDIVYRKPVSEVLWNDRNWRWETTGLGTGHSIEAKRHQKCSPLGGHRCRG